MVKVVDACVDAFEDLIDVLLDAADKFAGLANAWRDRHKTPLEKAAVQVGYVNDDDENILTTLLEVCPGLHGNASVPACTCEQYQGEKYIPLTIIHLNDYHQYSREFIANWLDSLPADLSIDMDRAPDGRPVVRT